MKKKTLISKSFKLNLLDLLNGLYISIAGVVLSGVIKLIELDGVFNLSWVNIKPILISGLSVGALYLLKRFVSDSNNKITLS